ncbi:MAG: DUF1343 domain-containing protein [Bacteroidetes bacterium]|nr:DUF1343 domain-containing protein [Bacteroidota bacterium]
MKIKYQILNVFTLSFFVTVNFFSFSQTELKNVNSKTISADSIRTGSQRTEKYFPFLKGKNVAVVANHTSMIGKVHLVDSLIHAGIAVKKIFCPEHGFRGGADAGEDIKNSTDAKTGTPVISLYGKHYKPKASDLKGIDVVVYDIQDVGVRFYTYISTMTYVMEACAENNIEFIILDRPDPNGFYVDGPVLEKKYTSYVGLHPVPIVYGMTIAEYALMVNGEGWLTNGIKCNLKYITVNNYNHTYFYNLPIPPSPNLPNMNSVYLYPSLGLFEGTIISVGRGTDFPFQVIGHPDLKNTNFSFTPVSKAGAKKPPFMGIKCNGFKLDDFANTFLKNLNQIYLFWLTESYQNVQDKQSFFNSYFEMLAGTATLRQQIISGVSEENIRKSWQSGINKFKKIRKKYLLYPDFE